MALYYAPRDLVILDLIPMSNERSTIYIAPSNNLTNLSMASNYTGSA